MLSVDRFGESSLLLQKKIQTGPILNTKLQTQKHPSFEQVREQWDEVATQSVQQYSGDKSIDPYVQLKRACLEMESIFVKIMFDAMKKSVHKENFLGESGVAQNIFEDMAMVHRARKASYTQSIGIAKSMYEQNVVSFVPSSK